MKKFLPIFLLLLMVLPISSAFASEGELILNEDFTIDHLITDQHLMFDKDLNTAGILKETSTSVLLLLEEEVTIKSFGVLSDHLYLKFFNSAGKEILNMSHQTNVSSGKVKYYEIKLEKVKKITIRTGSGSGISIYEMELLSDNFDKKPVLNLASVTTYKSADLKWENPVSDYIKEIVLKLDGVEFATLEKNAESYSFKNLEPETLYNFEVLVKYTDGSLSPPKTIKATTKRVPGIANAKVLANHDNAKISWSNPTDSDFIGVTILKDGVKVVDLEKTINNYTANKLLAEKEYTYEFVASYAGGYKSAPVPVTFTTLKAPVDAGDVVELIAKPTHNRVNLSWKLPQNDIFKHVNIYRDTLQKSFLDKVLGVKTVAAATPIFETNGTYFNDLTVKSETKYEYTLTTTSTEQVESDGVSVIVTTLKDPTPEIGGGGYDKDPDTGDYTYYWTEPEVGKVKVMVGGKLYATVPGADQKIVIKAKDMKYTIFGNPDVQLIPVDDDGNEGKPVKPPPGGNGGGGNGGGGSGNGNIPFNVMELMKITFDFIKMLGPFILVVLAIYLTPRLIKVIKQSMQKQGGG